MPARVPYDEEAERDALGAMLVNDSYVEIVFDHCNADDFYVDRNQKIARVVEDRWRNGLGCALLEVAADLETHHGVRDARTVLLRIQGEALSHYAARAAVRVAQLAACRRAAQFARDVDDVARAGDEVAVTRVCEGWEEQVRPPTDQVEPPLNPLDLVNNPDVTDYDWTIPGLLARRERLLLTGSEGGGKSTLVRQLAMGAAAGVHPFWCSPIPPMRVLYLDLENDKQESKREWARFTSWMYAGERTWADRMGLYIRPAGMDLTTNADERWLRAVCHRFRPDVLCLGPLYKAFQGATGRGKDSEETAELVTRALDRVRVTYDCTLIMEGHAPHGDNGDRANFRMRGSALWLGWPQFVIGMKRLAGEDARGGAGVQLTRARGFRDRTRRWPVRLFEGPSEVSLPWVAPADDYQERAS